MTATTPSLLEAAQMALEVCAEMRRFGDYKAVDLAFQTEEKIKAALALPEAEPVAEIVECQIMGQQTVREIDGRWKFLKYGEKLYAGPYFPAPVERKPQVSPEVEESHHWCRAAPIPGMNVTIPVGTHCRYCGIKGAS